MSEPMRIVSFFVGGMPQTKGSWRAVPGRGRARGRTVLKPDNEAEPAWREAVSWACKSALCGRGPTSERVRVAIEFVLPVPPSRRKTNRRDIDKLERSVLDALQGLAYLDDEQVDDLHATKRTTANANEIGAHVLVEVLPAT